MLDAAIWLSSPLALLVICGLAWWRGAAAEQLGSLLILAAYILANTAMAIVYPHFPALSMCLIDFALAVGLLLIALRYSSFWLGGAMLLQSLTLCLHAFDFAGDGLSRNTDYVINDVISYAMLACLCAGLAGSWVGKKRRDTQADPAALPLYGARPSGSRALP